MAPRLVFLIAALVAQQCSAVPVVLPASLFPSDTFSGLPLPTGAFLDIPKRDEVALPPLPGLPTGLPTGAPSLTFSLPPLPTGFLQKEKRQKFSSDLPTPTAVLTGLPTASGLPTGIPTGVPSGIPTGVPTGVATSLPAAHPVPGGLMRPGRV